MYSRGHTRFSVGIRFVLPVHHADFIDIQVGNFDRSCLCRGVLVRGVADGLCRPALRALGVGGIRVPQFARLVVVVNRFDSCRCAEEHHFGKPVGADVVEIGPASADAERVRIDVAHVVQAALGRPFGLFQFERRGCRLPVFEFVDLEALAADRIEALGRFVPHDAVRRAERRLVENPVGLRDVVKLYRVIPRTFASGTSHDDAVAGKQFRRVGVGSRRSVEQHLLRGDVEQHQL